MLEQSEVNKDNSEESNDIENKDLVKNEEILQSNSDKQCGTSEHLERERTKKPTFLDAFKASLIDLIVIGGISIAGVFMVDAILRLAGYFVTQKFQMSFVIFMIVMVLYMSIMESGKTSTTLGKKVSGLIITKG